MNEREGFAARWSRLKEDRRRDKGAPAPEEEAPLPEVSGENAEPAETAEAPPAIADEDLPDPDGLDLKGDFSVFMQAGVSKALQRRALRRLWSLDPVFANVDGLVEYGDDFRDAAKQAGSLRESGHAARRLARALRGRQGAPEETVEEAQDEERPGESHAADAPPDTPEEEDDA